MTKFYLFFMFLILLLGCDYGTKRLNEIAEKDKAVKVADSLYACLKIQDYKKVDEFLSKAFFSEDQKSILIENFKKTKSLIGDYESRRLIDWTTERMLKYNPSTDYQLIYETTYSKFKARETIDLTLEEGKIRIVKYQIVSGGLPNSKLGDD